MKIHLDKGVDKNNPILTKINDFIETSIDREGVDRIVIGEFVNKEQIPFTISLLLENGQLCYCKTPLERDLSNWEEVCSKLCLGYNRVIEEINTNDTYECVLNGRNIQFSRVYGTHVFDDDECKSLAEGRTIFFVADSLPQEGKEQYRYLAVGKLDQADYEGEDNDAVKLVGFRRYGFVRDMSYNGLRPYFKSGQLFSSVELSKLLMGEEIIHEFTNSKGNVSKVKLSYDHDTNKMSEPIWVND